MFLILLKSKGYCIKPNRGRLIYDCSLVFQQYYHTIFLRRV